MSPIWFPGICDRLFRTVQAWVAAWPRGEVYATRPFLDKGGVIVNIPTMRLVQIPFHAKEFEHMVRILSLVRPKWEVTADMQQIWSKFGQCKPAVGGLRMVPIATFQQDPEEILKALAEARDGKAQLEQQIDAARQGGKGIWE